MIGPKVIAAGVLVLSILVLILQNTEVVAVRMFFWEIQMSRVVLILVTTLIGFACGYLVATIVGSKARNP